MRVILAGRPAALMRLRTQLAEAGIEIVAEFDTVEQARSARIRADALVIAQETGIFDITDADEWIDQQLTPREMDVLELLAEGLPNKSIADRLGISAQTVKFHVSSISSKLGARNRTDVVRLAVRRGLLSL